MIIPTVSAAGQRLPHSSNEPPPIGGGFIVGMRNGQYPRPRPRSSQSDVPSDQITSPPDPVTIPPRQVHRDGPLRGSAPARQGCRLRYPRRGFQPRGKRAAKRRKGGGEPRKGDGETAGKRGAWGGFSGLIAH